MSDGDGSLLFSFFRGSSFLFFGLVFELAFRFVGKVFIAQVLGRTDFGTVALGITMVGVLSTIATVGLNTGIGRYLPRSDDLEFRRGVLLSSVQIIVPFSAGLTLAVAVGSDWLAGPVFGNDSLAPVFVVCSLAIPFSVLIKVAVGAVQGNQLTRPKVYLQNVVLPFTRTAFFVGAVALGLGTIGVAGAYTLSFVVSALVGGYYLYNHTTLFDRGTWTPMHRELLSFSVPVMVRNITTMVLVNLDTFLLAYLATISLVGVYNAVYPLAMLVTISHKAANFLYIPMVSRLHADGERDEIRSMYRSVTKWLFVVTLPLLVVIGVFPRITIGYTYGSDYVSGAFALSILAFGFFVHTVAGVNGGTLEAIGSTRVVMLFSIVVAALNALLNWFLIPLYGVVGAAVATTVAYLLLNSLYTARLYQETGISPFSRRIRRFVVVAGLLTLGLFAVVQRLGRPTLVEFVALLGAFTVCYAPVVLLFGVGEEDVQILRHAEEEFGVDLSTVRRAVRPFR